MNDHEPAEQNQSIDSTTTLQLAICMPAYNEADGICQFLEELDRELRAYRRLFVIVDDCSNDHTLAILEDVKSRGLNALIHRNAVNSGHGASTIRALSIAAETGAPIVVAVDGDGQFFGADVKLMVATILSSGADVVEGVRQNRDEPLFRQIVSLLTRWLVGMRVKPTPIDANTPLRAYRKDTLQALLFALPNQAATPNLMISTASRRWQLHLREVQVRSRPRLGSVQTGITWGRGPKRLPSRRFIQFCSKAAFEWIRFRTPSRTDTANRL